MNAADFARQNRVTDAQLRGYVPPDPEHSVKSILDYHTDVLVLLGGTERQGDTLPWKKTHEHFRFLPGEITVWHGINGHGKSAITTQVALWFAIHGIKSCIASFEMLPERTLLRMVKQAAGNPSPSDSFTNDFFMGLCQSLWIYDHLGKVDKNLLFTAIRYCATEKGIRHFFIDSLMKCVRGSDDYNGQKDFMEDLCGIASETKTHIHVIHHVRKGDDESKIPNKFDARGAGEITDLAHNVLAVWRNKKKERERDECLKVGAALNNETPDFLLVCDKQRNGGWEGNWALWGDVRTWHFRETSQESWSRGYEMPTYKEKSK